MKHLIAAILVFFPAAAWSLSIPVYHTSDVHGWYYSRPAKWDKENSTRSIGGFAAFSSLVKADKDRILLDSGDTFQGTPEGTLTKGMATAALMNQLGYAAATVGNHDYDYTEANLKVVISSSSFPWLGANVYIKDTGAQTGYLKPYVIVERAGKRIAVVGIAGRHTATSTLPANVKHLEFRDEAAEAARWTREAREVGRADAVIILAHLGLGGDVYGKTDVSTRTFTPEQASYGTLALARASKAEVVFGGHVHTGLEKGYHDPESGSLLAESYFGLTSVTRVLLEFDDVTGKFTGATAQLLPLWTDTTGEDPAVTETLKTYSALVDREMGKVISASEVDLGTSPTGLDSGIGNWFTDAMRRQARTDAAFQNTAGIRADIKKGELRIRDVFQVMPFENTLVKLTLTGDQIKRLIADNLRGGFSKLQLSGLKVRFRNTPEGPRDIVVERSGAELKPGDKLTVATNNYLTTGGTGGKVFDEAEKSEDTLLPIRDLLLKDLKENPLKAAPEGGRITRLD
ncbi:MAG: bifunctional metallophosphatase/5'-nucleotidase [Elusimicrobiales bacterium]|nr:bifunctional metallophosphatase/5'-nucleotidase [Elusimicrobiales bacterium]